MSQWSQAGFLIRVYPHVVVESCFFLFKIMVKMQWFSETTFFAAVVWPTLICKFTPGDFDIPLDPRFSTCGMCTAGGTLVLGGTCSVLLMCSTGYNHSFGGLDLI